MYIFRSECSSRTRFVGGLYVCLSVCNTLASLPTPYSLEFRMRNSLTLEQYGYSKVFVTLKNTNTSNNNSVIRSYSEFFLDFRGYSFVDFYRYSWKLYLEENNSFNKVFRFWFLLFIKAFIFFLSFTSNENLRYNYKVFCLKHSFQIVKSIIMLT